jgi:hypothetical protein
MIEKGWHMDIDRNQKFCFFCEDQIENKFHFILVCPTYSHLRENYINKKIVCIDVIQKRTDNKMLSYVYLLCSKAEVIIIAVLTCWLI